MIQSMAVAALAAVILTAPAGAQTAQGTAAGSFLVFFDWSKPELRRDDNETLDKVADAYRDRAGARILLTGHTDRSGRSSVNRLAGMRRAEAVRAELEKRGVARNAMTLASFGEDRPLVPTEDGVREVQNRRVEIAFEE